MSDSSSDDESEPVFLSPTQDVATASEEVGDPPDIVKKRIPADIFQRYEIHSYRNAPLILSETRTAEFNEILAALRNFSITTDLIRKAGGNESEIPKLFNAALRPQGWHATVVQGDLLVRLLWTEKSQDKKGRAANEITIARCAAKTFLMGTRSTT